MRALRILTVVMAVMIVAGLTVVVTTIVRRASAPAASAWRLALDEPAGSGIAGVTPAGPSLAVLLRGGGADRVVLIDPRTGTVRGRVALAR